MDKSSGKENSQKDVDTKTAGWLELHNGKLLRAVLRGEGGRKASDLPGALAEESYIMVSIGQV